MLSAVMAALNGLPASNESLIVAPDALGNDEKCFTIELVKSRLLQEEQRSLSRAATSTGLHPPVGCSECSWEIPSKGSEPLRLSSLCSM